jgi:hypothetical protein
MFRKLINSNLSHLFGALAFSLVGVSGALKGEVSWWPVAFFGLCTLVFLMQQLGWRPYLNKLELSSWGVRRTFGPQLRAKKIEEVAWNDVSKIEVETTDAGPAADDMFFWIHGPNGKGVIIPSEMAAQHQLVRELQSRFPSLDNRALAEASGCCVNRYFLLWKKRHSE